MSRKSKIEWFAVAFALTAGCSTTNSDAKGDAATSDNDVDSGVGASEPDGSQQPGDGDPWVVAVPDGGSFVDPEGGPVCGASSFAAEEVITETPVEVAVEITEEITEEITQEVVTEVTEEVISEKPASLYILFDQSASMNGLTGNGDLWTPAVAAMRSFVNDEASAGLGVGIQYFPMSGGSCKGAGYMTPDVQVRALPGNAKAISDSLGAHSPNGLGTPIEGALYGATKYCLSFQAAHPDQQCIAVLVTDGEPEWDNCEKNTDKLAAIAKAARDNGVITFAVGLKGANFALLDKIAKEGGAPDCDPNSSRYSCDVSSGASKLSEALAKIRETTVTYETHTVTTYETTTVVTPVTRTETRTEWHTEVQKTPVPCEWTIPESTDGPFNRDKLNVRWSVKDDHTTLLRVSSKGECRADGWYYDNPEQPERVIACGETCEEIKANEDSSVDLLIGCATIVPS